MWLCVLYSSPLFLHWQMAFASSRSDCMTVSLFCLPFPPLEFANVFRFTAIPLLPKCHRVFCIPLPLFVFANGFRFTAIPFIFDCMGPNICSRA